MTFCKIENSRVHLRILEQRDVVPMVEWMHDESVVKDLQTDFMHKTLEDCEHFISASLTDEQNIHLAIVDSTEQYLGTVSLKNIHDSTAEFAITIRASAMGKGIAKEAMEMMIGKGFDEIGLSSIYWCVSPDNKRAVRFYDKNGYHRVSPDVLKIGNEYSQEQIQKYIWYRVTKEDCQNRI